MRAPPEAPIGRLTRRPDFLAAATGRRFHSERVTLQGRIRPDGEAEGLRVGFTLTKRVGNAVVRNRIRRRLRAAAREVGPALRSAPLDVVVIGRVSALHAPYDALLDDLARGLATVSRPKSPRPAGSDRTAEVRT